MKKRIMVMELVGDMFCTVIDRVLEEEFEVADHDHRVLDFSVDYEHKFPNTSKVVFLSMDAETSKIRYMKVKNKGDKWIDNYSFDNADKEVFRLRKMLPDGIKYILAESLENGKKLVKESIELLKEEIGFAKIEYETTVRQCQTEIDELVLCLED